MNPTLDSFAFLSSNLSAADLALSNLESPLGEASEPDLRGYNLCAPAEHASLLAGWRLDLLALANNHADDCSQDGIIATQSALVAAGLTGLSPQPVRLEVNGLRLTFFAFDDISAPLDAEAAAGAIRLARAEGRLVIVSVHWGAEYQGAPTARQQAVAALFAEAGAHLIWGHHPHVLQSAAWLDASPGRTLVLYSLGNALFDMGGLDDTRQSALVLVRLDADGVRTAEAVPFVIDPPHSRVIEPDAETAEKILERIGLE